jgi:predicted nucleic acid-binding Zn ribbon protein
MKEQDEFLFTSGESNCCGAPVYDDYMMCSDCKEHCDYAPKVCGYCGDIEVEEDEEFCSKDCWKGYEHETFRKD